MNQAVRWNTMNHYYQYVASEPGGQYNKAVDKCKSSIDSKLKSSMKNLTS
jgi:hypothetical protein